MSRKEIKRVVWFLWGGVLLSGPMLAATANPQQVGTTPGGQATEKPPIRSYTVNKRVSDFPAVRDLSTPEAAYATIMRDFSATGASGSEWSEIALTPPRGTKRTPVSAEDANNYLNAYIEEVIIYKDRLASVIAKQKERQTVGYDRRILFCKGGRWLNAGQGDLAPTIEEARQASTRYCESLYQSCLKKAGRPPIADSESYLKPYVEFLSARGREPHAFLMEAFARYALVVMGEVHNRPTYWAFNRELVRDPAFAEAVGTIYLELPSNHQRNIDEFLAGGTCQKDLVIQMLRDFHDGGWPCQSTLEFFVAVWEVNRKLPADKRLRLRLVDQQWPWEKIRTREDWRPYWVDRDLFMAQNILKDRQTGADPRHGFFIVGMQHAMEGLYLADQTTARPSAGWHLRQSLGEQLFTVFQHAPVITNNNEARGRLALGLIDAAFARLQDRPVAFTLREGPFGKLPFDGMPDAKVYGSFRDGYDAYLYLTPLEDEILSPLIEGFYSDQFVREMDRRSRLMTGKPLYPDTNDPTGERVTRLWAESSGRPRSWIRDLGPENAWCYGDDWQTVTSRGQERRVTRPELVAELDKVYRGLKGLDPKKYTLTSWERAFGFDYVTMTNQTGMYEWWGAVLPEHPLESVEYGELGRAPNGLPQIQVTTTLHGGLRFSKTFEFRYRAVQQRWQALYGLDLHLDPQWKDFPKTHKIPSP